MSPDQIRAEIARLEALLTAKPTMVSITATFHTSSPISESQLTDNLNTLVFYLRDLDFCDISFERTPYIPE
jgi:hypothetical protein